MKRASLASSLQLIEKQKGIKKKRDREAIEGLLKRHIGSKIKVTKI